MENIIIEKVSHFSEENFEKLKSSFSDVEWDKEHLAEFLSSPLNIMLIAKKNTDICGILRAHVLVRYDMKNKEILLHEIDVLPEHQRQGIATSLIEKLKEIAKEMKALEIWVVTNRSNAAAMKLYEKTGAYTEKIDDVVLVYDF